MKWFIVFIVFVGVVWYFGFYSEDAIFKDYSGESGYFLGSKVCTDYLPKNPYPGGSVEYSGFQWGKDNPTLSCPNNSSLFLSGCREYNRQLRIYNECAKDNPR